MNRIDRLHAILTQLQSKKVVKAYEIADRFGISLRTVYRDIRALEESGVPIGAEAGVGYFIDESYHLPPVMFTLDEANALLLAGKLTEQYTDQAVNHDYQSAMFKIKAVLNSEKKERIESLDRFVKVFTGLQPKVNFANIYLTDIQKALAEHKIVKLKYLAGYSDAITERYVEPIGLIMYAMKWHLIGFCKLRNEYRDFRLDRIKSFVLTDSGFVRNRDDAFEEYLSIQKARNKVHEIRLIVTVELGKWLVESKYWYGFVNEKTEGERIVMDFINPDLEGFARWVITMLNQVEIEYPKELENKVKEMVEILSGFY